MENTSVSQPSPSKLPFGSLLARIRAVFSEVNIVRRPRRLRLCETLSLGEKRILALVECEDQCFLVAATPQNISLLQTMSAKPSDPKPKP